MRNPKRTKRKRVVIDGVVYDQTTVEVLEEFGERAGGDAWGQRDDGVCGIDFMYLPPWRERFPGHNKLGDYVEYGPTFGQLPGKMKKWRDTHGAVGSPGLWNPDESYRHECINAVTGEVVSDMRARGDARYDHDVVAEYVSRNSAEMSMQMLQIFVLYWRDGLSSGVIAKRMEIPSKTVDSWILRLRRRAADH